MSSIDSKMTTSPRNTSTNLYSYIVRILGNKFPENFKRHDHDYETFQRSIKSKYAETAVV